MSNAAACDPSMLVRGAVRDCSVACPFERWVPLLLGVIARGKKRMPDDAIYEARADIQANVPRGLTIAAWLAPSGELRLLPRTVHPTPKVCVW
jgi:hypothetical protein